MSYILLILMTGSNKGVFVQLEFSSKTKCEQALKDSKKNLDVYTMTELNFVCLEK